MNRSTEPCAIQLPEGYEKQTSVIGAPVRRFATFGRRPTIAAIAAIAVTLLLCLSMGWGKHLTAVVHGDIVLDYEEQLTVPSDVKQVEAEITVWNGGASALEVMGLATPCADCIEVEGIPTIIPPLQSRLVKVHLQVHQLPREKTIPLNFRLLCGRSVRNTEFAYSLYRKPLPVDNRVPTPARLKESTTPIMFREGSDVE